DRIYGVLRDLGPVVAEAGAVPEALEAALCDDLNTPVALAELSRLAGDARKAEGPAAQAAGKSALLAAGRGLNLLQQTPEAWFVPHGGSDALRFDAISDSAIVSGLIALLLRVYSGRPASEIVATEPGFVGALGLQAHLSPTRSNGLHAMLRTIKHYAAEAERG